jgi:hypothetical protein
MTMKKGRLSTWIGSPFPWARGNRGWARGAGTGPRGSRDRARGNRDWARGNRDWARGSRYWSKHFTERCAYPTHEGTKQTYTSTSISKKVLYKRKMEKRINTNIF